MAEQPTSKDLSSALGYMQAAHIALCEIRKPDDYVLKARDRLALATNILMPIVRAALEPPADYLRKREPIRRILFEELFVDARAQDYKDAAVRLWTEQYRLVARIKELEEAASAQPPPDDAADAARYRWLRAHGVSVLEEWLTGNELDEAIDAERSAPTKFADDPEVCPACGAKKDAAGEREHEAGCSWFEKKFRDSEEQP